MIEKNLIIIIDKLKALFETATIENTLYTEQYIHFNGETSLVSINVNINPKQYPKKKCITNIIVSIRAITESQISLKTNEVIFIKNDKIPILLNDILNYIKIHFLNENN